MLTHSSGPAALGLETIKEVKLGPLRVPVLYRRVFLNACISQASAIANTCHTQSG